MGNRLSPEQLARLEAAADANDPALYYQLLTEYGFGYGQVAREVVTETGLYGRTANNFLREKLRERGISLTDQLKSDIMLGLIKADLALRSKRGLVTVEEIADYHRQVFKKLHIPEEAWTGAFLDDRGGLAAFCPTCTEEELAGRSRWSAPREVWGDVIDDLTNETLDLGSGPSEGAASDAREWVGDLTKPEVGPKALFDHITQDPWWEPYVDWHPAYRYFNTSSEERSDDSPENLTALPSSTEVGVVTPDADGVIRMSIAPGETRTARVRLPGLTLDLTITMPR